MQSSHAVKHSVRSKWMGRYWSFSPPNLCSCSPLAQRSKTKDMRCYITHAQMVYLHRTDTSECVQRHAEFDLTLSAGSLLPFNKRQLTHRISTHTFNICVIYFYLMKKKRNNKFFRFIFFTIFSIFYENKNILLTFNFGMIFVRIHLK